MIAELDREPWSSTAPTTPAPAYWIDTVDLCFDLDPAKTRVLNKMTLRRNPDVPRQPLQARWRRTQPGAGAGQRPGHVVQDGRQPAGAGQPARCVLRAGNLHHHLPGQKHQADGPVRQQRLLLHPVRSRGLPAHHLFPGPPGRDGQLHRDAARRQGQIPGAAVQRQPGGARSAGRRPERRAPLCQMGRSAQKTQLPVCAGGRPAGGARAAHHLARRQGAPAAGLCAPRRPRQDRARHELADAFGGLGRSALWPDRWTWSAS